MAFGYFHAARFERFAGDHDVHAGVRVQSL
jgi:hypothetical protein